MSNNNSLFDALKKIDAKQFVRTKNKYAVVLYGSPASGKRIAKKIACKIICENFEPNNLMNVENIFESFVDTEVDSIIYNMNDRNNVQIKDKMMNAYKEIIKNKTGIDVNNCELNELKSIIKDNINEIVNVTSNIYMENKKQADAMSDLIRSYSVVNSRNIFFEISSAHIEYIKIVLDGLRYYDYIPIIVYPFISNPHILYNRSIERGIKEGRFFTLTGDEQSLDKKIKPLLDNYQNLKNIVANYAKYAILQYNSNIPVDVYRKFDEFNFKDNINTYTMDFIVSL